MTSPLSQRASLYHSHRSPQLDSIVVEFTRQLTMLAEKAAAERSQELLQDLVGVVRAEQDRPTHERQQWLEEITQQLTAAIAQVIQNTEPVSGRHALGRDTSESAQPTSTGGIVRRRPRRKPVRPPPPPLDPEQIKRDQEFARLRAILKPTADDNIVPEPISPASVTATPVVLPAPRPSSPGDSLHSLEKEIQDAVPTLGTLGPERCAARIAAWVGEVRGLRDRLPPDVAATMRPAFRIFLEHLEQLRAQMEANTVDALEHKWKAPDWSVYVEVNRAFAEGRPPNVSRDQLQAHHRAMLRALVLPHRRNLPQQALPIIEEAARVLPAEDNLLQSARRRHRTVVDKAVSHAPATTKPAPAEPSPAATAEPAPEPETTAFPAAGGTPPPVPEGEFDSPWIK